MTEKALLLRTTDPSLTADNIAFNPQEVEIHEEMIKKVEAIYVGTHVVPSQDYIDRYTSDAIRLVTEISQAKGLANRTILLEDVRSILLDGTFKGFQVDEQINGEGEYQATNLALVRRRKFLGIYQRNPETAATLAKEQIQLFHATRSGSLSDVAEHGLLSGREVRRRGIMPKTGEWEFQDATGQGSVSFAEVDDEFKLAHYGGTGKPKSIESLKQAVQEVENLLKGSDIGETGLIRRSSLEKRLSESRMLIAHLEANPNSLETELYLQNIPILWGISKDVLDHSDVRKRSGEFDVVDGIEPLSPHLLAVPREKIAYIQDVLRSLGKKMSVIPIEDVLANERDLFMNHEYVYGQGIVSSPKLPKEVSLI